MALDSAHSASGASSAGAAEAMASIAGMSIRCMMFSLGKEG